MLATVDDQDAEPRRSDARRSREAILEAARSLFIERGVLVPLDDVAKRAAVGNATLYRHFPTRNALIYEAMRSDIGAIQEEAAELTGVVSPALALQEWLVRLTWHLRTWHGLPESVMDALNNTASPLAMACTPLQERTRVLLEAAQTANQVRSGVVTKELFELVTLLSWGVDRFGDDENQARQRVTGATSGYFTCLPDTAVPVAG